MPQELIIVEMPGEPQAKGRPRSRIATGRSGQQFIAVYTPAKTRAYEEALQWHAKAVMGPREPLCGPLCVVVTASMGIPRSWPAKRRDAALAGIVRPVGRPDCDNFAKSALDALNGIIFKDDSQAVDVRVQKIYSEFPALRIEITPLDPPLLAMDDYDAEDDFAKSIEFSYEYIGARKAAGGKGWREE